MLDTALCFTSDVSDAVKAHYQQARPYHQHWAYYMNEEGKAVFGYNLACFINACRSYRATLEY